MSCLRHKSELVIYEAARAIVNLKVKFWKNSQLTYFLKLKVNVIRKNVFLN